ncbi:MAG: glycosyltransferase [Thermodesulfobacteriota bacterium]
MTNTIGPCKGSMIGDGPSGKGLFKAPERKLKKVLIVYFSRPPISQYLQSAFKRRGIDARGFYSDANNWFDQYVIRPINKTAHNFRIIPKSRFLFEDHPLCHLRYRNNKLIDTVNSFRPDLVMIIRGYRYLPEVIKEIRKKSLLFGWWVEKEEKMEEALIEVAQFDHYFFFNSSCIDEGRRRRLSNISLLQHSVDTSVFRPMECKKKYDWCFVGTWSPKRMEFLQRALQVSDNGVIYGSRWLKKNPFSMKLWKRVKGKYIEGDKLVRLYNESRVVINVTTWGFEEGKKRSGMNMRVLEVPACGTCLLTDGSRDMQSVISPGKHLLLYNDIEDFTRQLRAILSNDEQREKIAAAGMEHIRKKFSYDDIVDKVMNTYEDLVGDIGQTKGNVSGAGGDEGHER